MIDIIEQVRVGSHTETRTWYPDNSNRSKGHAYTETVTDYETVYHDCLVPKDWLKEHEHDLDGYEPTIELSVDGKTLSVNGDYKQGVIRNFVKANRG